MADEAHSPGEGQGRDDTKSPWITRLLLGALGISGDGVEQDDFVTAGGARSFEAPPGIRADQVTLRRVRLPYWLSPRNPEQ